MACTKYRIEENDDKRIIEIINDDDEAEEDDDIDANTEVFDDPEDKEDEVEGEETEEDEDNEEDREDVKAALEKERKRAQELTKLEKQAQRLGVSFNAAKAIKSGMRLGRAKKAVLDAAVFKSTSLKISPTAPHGDGKSKAKIHAKWATAWKAIQ